MTGESDKLGSSRNGGPVLNKAAALRDRIANARRQLNEAVIPKMAPETRVRASFAQERMWFNAKTSGVHAAYNSQVALHIKGDLDYPALSRSLDEICKRHDVCRMRLVEEGGIVWQEVRPPTELLETIALPNASEGQLRSIIDELITRPFDLERGPLVRWTLIRVAADRHVLVLSDHHCVTDGWSRQIVFEDLMQLYGKFHAGASDAALPEKNLGYRDFAGWQREWTEGEEGQKQIAFWTAKLSDAPDRVELPADFVRPPLPSYRGGHLVQTVDGELMAALSALCASSGVTSFMLFLAAFVVLLYQLTGRLDLPIGTGVANRRMSDTDGMVGMLINTVVIRARPDDGMSFLDLLRYVRELSLEAFANQEAPFDRVVQAVNPIRSAAINPLHQITFNFQNNPMPEVHLPGLQVELERPLFNGSAKYDLYVAGWPRGGERIGNWMSDEAAVLLSWEFSKDLFEEASVRRMMAQYMAILKQVATDPKFIIHDIAPDATGSDATQTAADLASQSSCIHGRFQLCARRTPDETAVQSDDTILTYAEVERISSGLASRLLALGLGKTAVGVTSRRSAWLPTSLLGILKAGGSYVPLDPDLPSEPLREIIDLAGITHVVCDERDCTFFEEAGLASITNVGKFESSGEPLPEVQGGDLAYVMFTSGSSGKQKAVAVPHRAVIRLVTSQSFAAMGPENVWLLHSPLAFDASTLEVWAPLCNGGRLVIQPDGRYSLRELGESIRRGGVDSLWLTSGLFQIAANECAEMFLPLSQLITGGDVVSPEAVRRVMQACPRLAIINGYGPTENTTFTCCGRILPQDLERRSIPIGVPIRGTTVFVLDQDLRPCLPGRIGELFTGGIGLADGYLGNAGATAESFIEHPKFARLYRTGDLCRVLADGRVEFIGRRDRQVKIAGHRVELGEVERRLSGLPGAAAVSVVVSHGAKGPFLRAAVVLRDGGGDSDLQRLKASAKSSLPSYQLPTDWRVLPELPVTPNGKIDHAAIQQLPVLLEDVKTRHPASTIEREVAAIWTEVLEAAVTDFTSDFFSLGGNSLAALRALSLIEKAFGVKLSASAFFGDSSVQSISGSVIEALRTRRVTAAKQARLPLIEAGPVYPTLLFVPGGWGEENELLVFAKLVRSMKINAAKFGVRSGVTNPHSSLETGLPDYAARLADMVSADIDPRHLIVIGECAASTVALSLVKELSTRGTPVLGLVLLDPGDPAHLRNVIRRISVARGNQAPIISSLPDKVAAYYRLLSQVPEGPVSVPLRLILSKRFSDSADLAARWKEYAGQDVAICAVSGDHNSYLRDHAEETARALDRTVSSLAGV